MIIGAIIQARMASTRLPGKVLKELPVGSGISVLAQVIRRAKKSKSVQKIIIATTANKIDDKIVAIAKKENVGYFRGSEQNVLSRYYLAAQENKLDQVIRITSDCPCIDYEILDEIVGKHIKSHADYTSNTVLRTFPRGLDAEVMKFSALRQAYLMSRQPHEKEHVTPYIYEHPEIFKIENFPARPAIRKYASVRLTLDTNEDYLLLCEIFDGLYNNPYFKISDIIRLFRQKPQLLLINKNVVQKTLI